MKSCIDTCPKGWNMCVFSVGLSAPTPIDTSPYVRLTHYPGKDCPFRKAKWLDYTVLADSSTWARCSNCDWGGRNNELEAGIYCAGCGAIME